MTKYVRACILSVMSDPTLTRRERKKEATREALLDAALSLFTERGFVATTVEDIANAADVAPRTFFRYFPNKSALLLAPDATHRVVFRRALAETNPDTPPLDRLHHAVRATLRALHEDRDRLRLQYRIGMEAGPGLVDDQFSAMWEAFEADVVEGLDVSADTARLLTGIAVGVAGTAVRRWLDGDADGDLGALADDGFATIRGLVLDSDGPTD